MNLGDFSVGDTAAFARVITTEDVEAFAALSGDENPLHLDPAYTSTTPFGKPIVHGMLLASLFSRLVGMQLPGRRSLYLSQSLVFRKPVFAGDEVEVRGTVRSISIATRSLEIETRILVGAECVVEGMARVQIL